MNTTPWPQELGFMKPMEDLIMASSSTAAAATTTNNNSGGPTAEEAQLMERRSNTVKAQHNNSNSNSNINNIKDHHHHHQALNCPRCNSTNTKFCYYNNYSLTQPRYFCKTCRRYWTEGGSLRNVPVGGGSRKNKKSSTSTSTSAPTRQNPNLSFPAFTDLGGTQGRPPYFPGPMSAMMPVPPPPPEFLSTATTTTTTTAEMGFMFPFEGVRRSSISDSNGGDPAPDHHLLPPPLGFWNGMMGGSTSGGSTW